MPTPACRAIALREALLEALLDALPEAPLEAANASRAAVRMRSRLVRASFLDGFWFTGDVVVRPVSVACADCKSGGVSGTLVSVTEGSPFYCDTGGGRSWPSWFCPSPPRGAAAPGTP